MIGLLKGAESSVLLGWTSPATTVAIPNTSSVGSLSWHKVISEVIVELGDKEEGGITADVVTSTVSIFSSTMNNHSSNKQ